MSKNAEVTEKEELAELRKVVEQLQQKAPTKVYKVVSGPYEHRMKKWYRVGEGSETLLATFAKDLFFSWGNTDLEPGVEVLVMGSLITGVVPKELIIKEEPKHFNLITWNEIGGQKSQLEKIRDAVEIPLKNAKIAKEFGFAPLKGVLLYGPPGCGNYK